MVLAATTANNYTATATSNQNSSDLQREVDLTERSIRNAANRKKFYTRFDARIIGNPVADPNDDSKLTPTQIAYRDAFVNAGYLVTIDALTGFWGLSWASQGATGVVSVYSVRTTLTAGAISSSTATLITDYLNGLIPSSKAQVTFNTNGSGGDISESDFGGTNSPYYEYVVVVQQQNPVTDLSAGITTVLTSSSLGYTSTPSNVATYKLT